MLMQKVSVMSYKRIALSICMFHAARADNRSMWVQAWTSAIESEFVESP
jgi:hypothetical protein